MSTYLFTKDDPHRAPYKPAFDVDYILQNRDNFEATIKARKSTEIDFDKLKRINDNFNYWNDKESQCILKIDDCINKEQTSDNSDKLEKLTLLSKVYRAKATKMDRELHEIIAQVPNLHDPETTPDTGLKVLEENEVRNLPVNKVKKVKSHEELGESLGILRQHGLEFVTNTKGQVRDALFIV